MIAGHIFGLEGLCSCGKRFTDIANTKREDIGKVGIAHQSYLSEPEYNQIDAERERIWFLVVNSSRDSPPSPVPPLHDDAHFEFST